MKNSQSSEDVADLGAEHISKRRRDSSISDDFNIQVTNDEATECKRFAVSMGYWNDIYVECFGHGAKPERREPEINRGYWARIAAIRKVIDDFLKKTDGKGQILNFGSGFDTLYWQLCNAGTAFSSFVDVDFSSITAKKIHQIMKPGSLLTPFVAKEKEQITIFAHTDLHAPKYHLIGADLRQINELSAKLNSFSMDLSLPTLVLSECVLVYMDTKNSADLVRFIADTFPTSCWLNYEQVNLEDKFGSVMKENLHNRGIPLAGVGACESLETQKERFLSNGFSLATAFTMQDVYMEHLPSDERNRIVKLEMLDEQELLEQLLQHYALTFATKSNLSCSSVSFFPS